MNDDGLIRGEDALVRCWWPANDAAYVKYHDEEWGRPTINDFRLFEKICLEGFQAGLSWLTILRKRESFRNAFHRFDFNQVARFGETDVLRLLGDAGIVRHRGKIESTINNAKRAIELKDEYGSLARYFWQFEPPGAKRPSKLTKSAMLAAGKNDESVRLSRDLKKRGWRFVGPTTAYAFMQAMGLVNDHLHGCHVREPVEALRRQLVRP